MATFQSQLDSWAERTLKSKMVETTKKVAKHVGEQTPQESGNAHEIWQSAFNKVPGVDVSFPERSGDPEAAKHGEAEFGLKGVKQKVSIHANAGFIRTIEYGGIIKPIQPGGTKQHGGKYPGPFLSPRNDAPPAGFICFRGKDGTVKFARSVKRSANMFVNKAVALAANEMRQ